MDNISTLFTDSLLSILVGLFVIFVILFGRVVFKRSKAQKEQKSATHLDIDSPQVRRHGDSKDESNTNYWA